jgi:hypothetical protein
VRRHIESLSQHIKRRRGFVRTVKALDEGENVHFFAGHAV